MVSWSSLSSCPSDLDTDSESDSEAQEKMNGEAAVAAVLNGDGNRVYLPSGIAPPTATRNFNRYDVSKNATPVILNISGYTGMTFETLEQKMNQHRAQMSNGRGPEKKRAQRRKKRALRVEKRVRRATRWEEHMEAFAQFQVEQNREQRESKYQVFMAKLDEQAYFQGEQSGTDKYKELNKQAAAKFSAQHLAESNQAKEKGQNDKQAEIDRFMCEFQDRKYFGTHKPESEAYGILYKKALLRAEHRWASSLWHRAVSAKRAQRREEKRKKQSETKRKHSASRSLGSSRSRSQSRKRTKTSAFSDAPPPQPTPAYVPIQQQPAEPAQPAQPMIAQPAPADKEPVDLLLEKMIQPQAAADPEPQKQPTQQQKEEALDASIVTHLKVADLRAQLKKRGLPVEGLKGELQQRLINVLTLPTLMDI